MPQPAGPAAKVQGVSAIGWRDYTAAHRKAVAHAHVLDGVVIDRVVLDGVAHAHRAVWIVAVIAGEARYLIRCHTTFDDP